MRTINTIIILLLIGIPLYFLFNKNADYQSIMIGAFVYVILIVFGVYARYFIKPPKSE
ncbi:MAG: hypothetical protein WHT29_01585 [Bacteroidales bacterium]|nr:hypothetical protein [Bacteroidales bacterium]HOK98953.1 hypothetical protein [Bacteroidales bacterium]HPO65131.1 hypothetical protein [Bacteroidales bacterium]